MSEQLRTIDLVPEFLDGLAHLQQYHSQFSPVKGRELSSAILDFAYHTWVAFLWLIPATRWANTPTESTGGRCLDASLC